MTHFALSPLALLFLLDYAVMYALPHVFFRRDGKMNLRWWLVASPFAVGPAALVLAAMGSVSPLVDPASTAGYAMALAAVPICVASLGLVFATVASHRVPLALWQQENDAPHSIVTHGPYRWVRHPFYSSFLLLLAGTVLILPHVITLATFGAGFALLEVTARREEKRLSASAFGAEYIAYKKRTGRFIPRPAALFESSEAETVRS